jgi:hypothetical protein
MSVAPEIARLAEAVTAVPAQPTLGTLARRIRFIAATPERWWRLVSFEPDRSVQITVEECAAYRAWLVVLPPGDAGRTCDCDVVTMIAGEATEGTPASAVLRPGTLWVHGPPHVLRGIGSGYSVSLHARAFRPPSHPDVGDKFSGQSLGKRKYECNGTPRHFRWCGHHGPFRI